MWPWGGATPASSSTGKVRAGLWARPGMSAISGRGQGWVWAGGVLGVELRPGCGPKGVVGSCRWDKEGLCK